MVWLNKSKIYRRLCYIDVDSFIVQIKLEDIYVDISKDVETRFETSNPELGIEH